MATAKKAPIAAAEAAPKTKAPAKKTAPATVATAAPKPAVQKSAGQKIRPRQGQGAASRLWQHAPP